MGFEPPQRLVRTLGELTGDTAAAAWLGRLPALAAEAVARRGLEVERVVAPGGGSGLVLLVRRSDGSPAALKLAPPFAAPALERAALAHWQGWGAARLLDAPDAVPYDAPGAARGAEEGGLEGAVRRGAEGTVRGGVEGAVRGDGEDDGGAAVGAEDGALLLERLHPEMSLRSLPEAKALLEAAGTVRRLWIEPPAGHGFGTVAERTGAEAERLRVSSDESLAPLVTAALAARDELCAAPPEELLLHGAFRQGKVLAGDRTPWLAVGPEPVVGERAYDLARLARDRVEDLVAASSGASSARRRVNRLADSLDLDRERLRGWTLFRAVESGARALAAGRRQSAESLLEFAGWL
ncbi:aminoglycoside phosphotransferase family protein [Streptomyces sp. NPDC059142]|uniref:aminoglycoside phosphotransferase family protein n=1 Tax=Streptomyces sp. NPDC059142 TaxID=3346739 RepID=UPI003692FDF5